MSEYIDTFKGWAEPIRQDLEAFKALLESPKADEYSKKLAGAALLYMVSRMDLIPDWNEGIGVIDDVMILRVSAQLSQGHERGALPTSAEVSLDRMANEADEIKAFLGATLYDKLKAYCAKLSDTTVRGRTPIQLVGDAAMRKALAIELDDELKRSVPMVIADPKDAELRLKAYLTHKLQ
ncbi:MAG: YkvA family protein [Proteobacteria bacterium]|nr:YkvA family protein [Pseudomonadota bacterium]